MPPVLPAMLAMLRAVSTTVPVRTVPRFTVDGSALATARPESAALRQLANTSSAYTLNFGPIDDT